MAEIANIKLDDTSYALKDTIAREAAATASEAAAALLPDINALDKFNRFTNKPSPTLIPSQNAPLRKAISSPTISLV